jgi:dihydrofolate reductase
VPRQLIAYELLSLDGVAEHPDEFITEWDETMDKNLDRVISSQDTVLLGRRTYDDWADFWPASTIEPFASFINPVEKFVVTSTTPGNAWTNATVVSSDVVGFVTNLKSEPGGDIGLHGSIELTQALLEHGVVDELRLVVAPTLQMRGRRLFEKGRATRLTLTREITSPSGYLLLDFRIDH